MIGLIQVTLAQKQLQTMLLTFFLFMPSIRYPALCSPFLGMPQWAQAIGNVLPLTHFLQLVRGILLKGNELAEL